MQEVNLIKIGSDSISDSNTKKLVDDIERQSIKSGEGSMVISSGSVVLAKKYLGEERAKKKSKSALSTIGQTKLMNMYANQSNGIVAQLLLDDYVNRDYLNKKMEKIDIPNKYMKFARDIAYRVLDLVHQNKDIHLLKVLEEHIRDDVLAILNHNDGMSSMELSRLTSHADNDQNAVYISNIVNRYQAEISFKIKRVIFLTNTAGILDKNGNTVMGSNIEKNMHSIHERNYLNYVHAGESSGGTGGMGSKITSAIKCLSYDVDEVIIANASDGLDCILNKENCTTFTSVPSIQEAEPA